GAVLSLFVQKHDKEVIVEVADNGVGMDELTKKRLLGQDETTDIKQGSTKEHTGHSTGLGLQNVIKRLQLFYSKEQVVEIESQPG
ncbi:histidine kinase, partial [Alkalihalophilus pseudofirmus]|nr:histidine kinase [Alkalihalophilus pseudofirmus]